MSKKYAIFITALFLSFLGVFAVANAATPAKEFSPMENRTLAQMPELSKDALLSGTFMEDFETFVTDQFVLRDEWIALKAGAEYASGKRENNGVYICDEHTLIPRFDPPANDRAKKRIDDNFGYVEKLASLTDAPVYFSLLPSKVSVWSHLLPDARPTMTRDSISPVARLSRVPSGWMPTPPLTPTRMSRSTTAPTITGPAWAHITPTPH